MPQTYSLNSKQTMTLDAPVRRFEVQQGSVIVSKHDEVIPTTVEVDETFAAGDRGGLDLFSPDSATLSVLFTEEAQLAESDRHPGEGEARARKRQRRKAKKRRKAVKPVPATEPGSKAVAAEAEKPPAPAAKKPAKKKPAKRKAASRGDAGGATGSFESRTLDELRADAAKRKIPGRSKMDKKKLIAALRKAA